MYAIITDGGRQYKVVEGQELEIDYREIPQGDQLTFDRVLALSGDGGLKLGQPTVAGATVTAEVLGPTKGEKIYIQKFVRRKNYRRRTGHRQIYTKIRISQIAGEPVSQIASEPVSQIASEPAASQDLATSPVAAE
jgi:large subunit ribosomal protein L21